MKLAAKQRDDIILERQRLEAEISQQSITMNTRRRILEGAAVIRQRLHNPIYEQKRELQELLDFRAIFRVNDAGRWLDVSCGLKPEGDIIELCPS